jgi:hypothetical protein
MSSRSRKGTTMPPGTSLLDMMESGEGFGSLPPEEVPVPPAGSVGELLARVEEDRAYVRQSLDDARPYLDGIGARNKKGGEGVKRRGHVIVEVWKSSGGNLTLAEAVRQAEAQLGVQTVSEDPFDVNAMKRGREALARIGMKWVRAKGPEKNLVNPRIR